MEDRSPSPGGDSNGRPLAVVTVLFMDMVDNVELKQQYGDQVAGAMMQRHDDEVRRLLSQIEGAREIKHNGDEFLLLFQRPSDAVVFAMRLQAWLATMRRKEQFPIRNRTGIHTGEVTLLMDPMAKEIRDLRGIQVDICSRVMRFAAPGQVVVTQFVAENARQMLLGLPGSEFGELNWVSRGRRRLKGVREAMKLFEVRPGSGTGENFWPDGKPKTSALWVGAMLAILSGLLFLSPLLRNKFALPSYDYLFLAHSEPIPDEVVVVYQDELSHQKLKQPANGPWDHALHANLLDQLTKAGATTVVFDILFDVPPVTPEEHESQRKFIHAITNHGRVALAAVKNPPDIGGYKFPTLDLREAAHAIGTPEAILANEGFFRQHFAGERREGTNDLHSLAWQASKLAAPRTAAKLDPWEERWIRFYGPPLSLTHFSYYQILQETNWQAQVRGKTVYVGTRADPIGFTGGREVDEHPTPHARWTGARMPGVEICATTFLNLLRGDWLKRTSLGTELALLFACGALFGWGLAWFRPIRACVLSVLGVGLIGLLAWTLVWATGVWFPWLVISAVQIPAALFSSILFNTERPSRGALAPGVPPTTQAPPAPDVPGLPPAGPPSAGFAERSGDTAVLPKPKIPNHTLLRRIGNGAYGEVWLCRNAVGIFHAAKILYRKTFKSEDPFEREFQGISKFMRISRNHPGFVNILHVGREDGEGYFFYIMELADDELPSQSVDPGTYSARTLDKELSRRGGHLPAAECIELGIALTSALDCLHEHGLVHRDIKPANIIFVAGKPKLADIGLVTGVGAETLVGTQGYMPPEGPGKPSADQFSLGKVLYVASTGMPVELSPELPSDFASRPDKDQLRRLNKIFCKACDPYSDHRYPSAAAMRTELLRIQNSQ